jgi:tetratricopeptide (TPR) repeat protein/transcriptional regulator with XRE-family HTH domain
VDAGTTVAFGTLLRRHRVAAGLTQEELAERAGISRRNLGDLERGVGHSPRKDTVALLAEALALSPLERAALAEAARRIGATTPLLDSGVGTGTLPAAPFVGRRRELTLLEQHLRGEGPPLLLLAGEPGIGKTRLLHAALPRAATLGLQVLQGGCQRRGGQDPYAPLVGSLQRYLRDRRPRQLRAELQGCAWLVRLLPELAEQPIPLLPAWTLRPEQEKRLMGDAVVRMLTNVAGPSGTLLLLDDLQWAGPDAIDLLALLVRSATEVPLRIIGTYRDTEVQPRDPLSGLLADLAQAGLVARRLLDPLAPEEAAQLLDELLVQSTEDGESARRAQILRRTGGVPFFVVSYAQDLHRADWDDDTGETVPWSVGQSIRQRVALLPDAAQLVLGVAAVAGREAPRALLAMGIGQPEELVLAGVAAACRAGLLEEQGADGYRFPHDIVREVVEADLGAARRALLHRRIGEALERLPGVPQPVQLAYHYLRAGERERAAVHLEQAGNQARAQGALADAEAAYRELVACLDGLVRPGAIAQAREKLGEMLLLQCHYDEALGVLEGAADAYRAANDLEGLLRVMAAIGWAHDSRGTAQEGLRRLLVVVSKQDLSTPSPGLALVLAALAALHTFTSGYSECLATAERAVAMARTLGDDRILVHTGRVLAWARFFSGQFEEALQEIQVTCQLAETVGAVGELADLLHAAAVICEMRGEFDRGKQFAQDGIRNAEQLGMVGTVQVNLTRFGVICFFSGAWAQARTHYTRALAIAAQADSHTTLLHSGQLHLAEGSWELARSHLQQSSEITRQVNQLHVHRVVESHLAELDVLSGDPESAYGRLLPLLEQAGREDPEVVTYVLPRLAWAAIELGELDQAERLIGQALSHQRAHDYRLAQVDTLRVLGLHCMRQGQSETAASAFEEGLRVARQIGCPYGEGRLLQVYGTLWAEAGDHFRARERLQAALTIFCRLGARKDVEWTEQLLSNLG